MVFPEVTALAHVRVAGSSSLLRRRACFVRSIRARVGDNDIMVVGRGPGETMAYIAHVKKATSTNPLLQSVHQMKCSTDEGMRLDYL